VTEHEQLREESGLDDYLFEWRNLMWDGRCKAVHIVSTIESEEHTQLRCEECTYTQLALSS
jgi:hypothetical protein